MLNGNHTGRNINSGGIIGRSSQRHWPKRANQILVKTRAFGTPPCSKMNSRARRISGRSGSTPASFSAK